MSGPFNFDFSGSESSGASSANRVEYGNVIIPPELFQFPEYPAALAAGQGFNSPSNIQINPVTVGLVVAGLFVLKKWGK